MFPEKGVTQCPTSILKVVIVIKLLPLRRKNVARFQLRERPAWTKQQIWLIDVSLRDLHSLRQTTCAGEKERVTTSARAGETIFELCDKVVEQIVQILESHGHCDGDQK